jgi:dihydroxy-acid dehydratase
VAILRGSLAPEGAVVKVSGLSKEELTKKGPARVFESEGEACEHLLKGEINPGDMVILRYVGPKGDPGMRLSGARFLWLLSGMNLDTSVTLISDGRFSGTNKGGAVGHISGGHGRRPDRGCTKWDRIEMDITKRRLDLVVPEEEIKKRFKSWSPPIGYSKRDCWQGYPKPCSPLKRSDPAKRFLDPSLRNKKIAPILMNPGKEDKTRWIIKNYLS